MTSTFENVVTEVISECCDVLRYLGEGVTLLRGALGLAGWVAEREDDWPLVERGHVSDDLLAEGSGHGGHSCEAAAVTTFRLQKKNKLCTSPLHQSV